MKKTIKYLLFIMLLILITLLLPIFIDGEGKESNNKEFANTTLYQIVSYYQKNSYYPQTLNELSIYNNKDFINNAKNNSFKYQSYGKNKDKYIFSWRGGAMNWTGYSCTNDKSKIYKESVIRTYNMPDGSICTVIDLH